MNTEDVIKQKPKDSLILLDLVIQQTIFKCQTPEKFLQNVSAIKFSPPYLFYTYMKTLDFAALDPVRPTN